MPSTKPHTPIPPKKALKMAALERDECPEEGPDIGGGPVTASGVEPPTSDIVTSFVVTSFIFEDAR